MLQVGTKEITPNVISKNVAFSKCRDSDEPVQPPFKLRNSQ